MPLTVSAKAKDSEKHEWDVNYLLYHKGRLYSAADDGKIIAWSNDLQKLAECQAHPCSVYCLTGSDDTLYSCSNEGTIKTWELDTLKEKETIVSDSSTEFWRVSFSKGCLFSGDDKGNIRVYKDNKFYGEVNISEPVKDMAVSGTMVFTVKDLDLVVTEIKLEGEKIQYGTKKSYMGRAPVALIGDRLFAFSSRDGKEILVHENSNESHFKEVDKIPNAHEMIINALAGAVWDSREYLFSGGWDKVLKKWDIVGNTVNPSGSCKVDMVINSITTGEKGTIFCGGADGHLLKICLS